MNQVNKYPIIQSCFICDIREFIQFWSSCYSYQFEELYKTRIDLQQYTQTDIENLFEWKNGMELSGPKKISLKNNVTDKLNLINNFKSKEKLDVEEFKLAFKPMSAVWKIFLLHLIKPDYYPIYDQHIHRAYLYIHQKDYSGIKNTISNKAKEDFYFKEYLEFVHSI